MNRTLAFVESSAELGGAELSLLPIVERLSHEMKVLALLPAHGPLDERLIRVGAQIHDGFLLDDRLRDSSPGYGRPGGVLTALAAVRQQQRLALALRRLKPSIVYCNGFRAQLGATVPALLSGASVVWHVRDFARTGPQGRLWSLLSRRVELIIANSRATAGQPGLEAARNRVVAIPNGIDLDAFRPRAAEPQGPQVIGMAAHLTRWKGHERFLRVLRRVRDELGDVQGRIAGAPLYDTAGNRDGAAWVTDAIARLDLVDHCTVESIPPESMPVWLGGLTALVHCPDRPEPFGRALAEAMAVGVPVVLAGTGGALEVVGDAGIVVPQGDDDAVSAAVLRLLSDSQLRSHLGSLGPGRAARCFDERDYVDSVISRVRAL